MSSYENAMNVLVECGYDHAGETARESYGFITQNSYPFVGSVARLGGRQRFAKGSFRATVGKRTVCLYKMIDKKASNMVNVNTKEFTKEKLMEYEKSEKG